MGSIPVLKPSEVVDILRNLGFELVRQRGSHLQFRDARGRGTTVPAHQGRDIAPALLRQIAKDSGQDAVQNGACPKRPPSTPLSKRLPSAREPVLPRLNAIEPLQQSCSEATP